MKIVIVGGVAAGTKTAAKLRREDPSAEVIILTKSKDISYAGCGLPYYVSEVIPERKQLLRVWLPSSPNSAASGSAPIPTESNTTTTKRIRIEGVRN